MSDGGGSPRVNSSPTLSASMGAPMLLSVALVCAVAFSLGTVLLLLVGHRMEATSRIGSVALAVVTAVAAGELAAVIWELPTMDVAVSQVVLVGAVTATSLAAPRWNPAGHLFIGTYTVSALAYLLFAGVLTVAGGLGPLGTVASAVLLVLEAAALVLTWLFSFEACDVLCRTGGGRRPPHDPDHVPFVSVHVAAYDEPPGMLIETIRSLEALDYPRYEIVVVDNNTEDPEVWQPVRDHCRDRDLVRFVHVAPWPGAKAGALNLALREHTSDEAEVIGVVDADYQVEPGWLADLVGYFCDPGLGFLQSPQDYRGWRGDTYLTACYDALRYFFSISLTSRNFRNGAMFSGTMGLIRRSALEEVGGWDEWVITEDAELSIRLLKAGYGGHFVDRSYGHGIMPLTFGALKRQRYRWAFGGMQTLRLHWRSLIPWGRDAGNRMSPVQRLHHLAGNSGWFIDPVIFSFAIVLYAIAASTLLFGEFTFRPLYGAAILLPVALLVNGVMRGVWALTHGNGISYRRGLLGFVNFLSLSWTVTLACGRGLISEEGSFLRTPKWEGDYALGDAMREARPEILLAAGLFAAGAVTAGVAEGIGWFLVAIFAWQGLVYASAPLTAYLAADIDLTEELALRRRWVEVRQTLRRHRPLLANAALLLLVVGVGALFTITGPESSERADRLFRAPGQGPDRGPVGRLLDEPGERVEEDVDETTETPTPTEVPPGGASPGPDDGPATPGPPEGDGQPTDEPGQQPTDEPGQQPTDQPGQQPTDEPGQQPTGVPAGGSG